MNIEYNTSKNGDYVVIVYSVGIHCKDDGAHYALYNYNGYMLLKGDDVGKSDDELYDMVIENLKENYKKFNHITFEEQLDDPAFEYINISVKKEIFYDKQIKITK